MRATEWGYKWYFLLPPYLIIWTKIFSHIWILLYIHYVKSSALDQLPSFSLILLFFTSAPTIFSNALFQYFSKYILALHLLPFIFLLQYPPTLHLLPHLLLPLPPFQLDQDFCTAIFVLLGNFADLLGNFKFQTILWPWKSLKPEKGRW